MEEFISLIRSDNLRLGILLALLISGVMEPVWFFRFCFSAVIILLVLLKLGL